MLLRDCTPLSQWYVSHEGLLKAQELMACSAVSEPTRQLRCDLAMYSTSLHFHIYVSLLFPATCEHFMA